MFAFGLWSRKLVLYATGRLSAMMTFSFDPSEEKEISRTEEVEAVASPENIMQKPKTEKNRSKKNNKKRGMPNCVGNKRGSILTNFFLSPAAMVMPRVYHSQQF